MKKNKVRMKMVLTLTLMITLALCSHHTSISADSLGEEVGSWEDGELLPPADNESLPIVMEEGQEDELQKETLAGDLNEDGKVSVADLALVALSLGKDQLIDTDWEGHQKADVNQDNKVDIEDLMLVATFIVESSD